MHPKLFIEFFAGSLKTVARGGVAYWLWLALLVGLIAQGTVAWLGQVDEGLVVTAMRDQVSWGFYIGNFTFLVGVAAAAVVLVVPAYIYAWGPIREIVIFGELLAVSAIVMCLLFVTVDIGRPDRFWHLFPPIGHLNFPSSLLAWDVVVLNGYFLVNFAVVTHLVYSGYMRQPYSKRFVYPLVILSIPMAISIHTVTAFLYNGLPARPFWNSALLAPMFLASAFCAGPAILLVLLQVVRRVTRFQIRDEAIWKIAELMAYAMFLNLFLHGCELFKEYYSDTEHLTNTLYLWVGIGRDANLVPYAWAALILNSLAFSLFILPVTRKNPWTMNLGCAAIYAGCYIEKGMALILPGQTPDTLGEIYAYHPTLTELRVAAGVFSVGFLIYTLMLKVALPIALGEVCAKSAENRPWDGVAGHA